MCIRDRISIIAKNKITKQIIIVIKLYPNDSLKENKPNAIPSFQIKFKLRNEVNEIPVSPILSAVLIIAILLILSIKKMINMKKKFQKIFLLFI